MGNDVVITFLLFLSINIVIYVALLRWASRINDIEKNLKSIDAKLDILTGMTLNLQGQGGVDSVDDNKNESLH